MTPLVTVVIPSFRRPTDLSLAMDSLFAQTGAGAFHITVVDNDPSGSAMPVADAARARLPSGVTLDLVHEPDPGVANARNAAIKHVRTRLIAFLDDDQTASPDWLAQLLASHARYPAAVTFGPVQAVLPDPTVDHAGYLQQFFSRPNISASGYTNRSFGCGNSLIDLDLLPKERPLFDARTNETGGEDDFLFGRVRASGGKFAWCAEAAVFERVPASRAHLGYTLRRAIGYGQGPITSARHKSPPDWLAVMFWMGVGLAKLLGHGCRYAVGWIVREQNRAFHLDQAARGFGKLIWWVQMRFYGNAIR
jgi:succinoglycan biosynthesis protein ExoM